MNKLLSAVLSGWILLPGAAGLAAGDGYQGWADETTDFLQAEVGTPIPRILELQQVLERGGRPRQICAFLESNARFNGQVRMKVTFDTPDGAPVRRVRFRFGVFIVGEAGSRGVRCKRPKELEVPPMTVATYRFKLVGPLLREGAGARIGQQPIERQIIGFGALFERDRLQAVE